MWVVIMDIRKISDSVAIYSDGKRLQVIHNLGDEFILDFKVGEDSVWWHNPGGEYEF